MIAAFWRGTQEVSAADRPVESAAMASEPVHAPLRLLIFDLDGVVYRGTQPVDGAPELVARLHEARIVVRYATNNSMSTRARVRDVG